MRLLSPRLTGEIADAAVRDLLDNAVAEVDPRQPPQFPLTGETDDAPRPPGRSGSSPHGAAGPLGCGGRRRCSSRSASPDGLGLKRWSELGPFAQHDLGDGAVSER